MPPDSSWFEALRQSYRPPKIASLFIGESRPAKGTFFYLGNSQVYRYMKEVLGGGDNFLREFEAFGWFLDDLCLDPVNDKLTHERERLRRDAIAGLATRVREYRPQHIVTISVAIGGAVAQALQQAGVADVPNDVVPFPGNGQQGNFRRRMHAIIPRLPKGKN